LLMSELVLEPKNTIRILSQKVRYFRPFAHNPDDKCQGFFVLPFFDGFSLLW